MALSARVSLLLIFCLTVFTIQTHGFLFGEWCLGAHQEYSRCGSACPLTCSDVRHARYFRLCTHQCVQGCICKRGYTRRSHPKSQCIPDWRC
ncbi:unnamed protein product [Rotaria socialis]|uniref:TIL domain-containing protein n=1 Tax=Rotaria socialis TaxID=392032 RepID=A0A820X4W1_9BILA|nr:unnamed protein product [Rotaria socialis]CAF3365760.1 unnamed protein product [Rotaria socialis]CAF3389607.1 unnamed protein product [Rotaria socialis]CAF3473543.1 unnamed protein product [Rotaria socialis]CAF3579200.1 unnamed protein product [Rotaria socialis]